MGYEDLRAELGDKPCTKLLIIGSVLGFLLGVCATLIVVVK